MVVSSTNTVIVGGGPAGLAVLLAARKYSALQDLVSRGLIVIEKTSRLGCGDLGSYVIRSDSFADSFLASANTDGIPSLSNLVSEYPGRILHESRGGPVLLSIAAEYLNKIGDAFCRWDEENGYSIFRKNTFASKCFLDEDGTWNTLCANDNGHSSKVRSKSLVLACGAVQSMDDLYINAVGGTPLLPRFANKTVLSKEILSFSGAEKLYSIFKNITDPSIAIVGGSHSAISSALLCLNNLERIGLKKVKIIIIHRNKICLTYPSRDDAYNDGYFDFQDEDVCSLTGRVYPLAGLRSESRELVRGVLGLGGRRGDDRVAFLKVTDSDFEDINRVLIKSDLIVSAMGYRPRIPDLFDANGKRFSLKFEAESGAPLVDHNSRLLDQSDRVVPNVYGIGLASGFPMRGRFGERSFTGQANGLALWQSDIGYEIVRQIINRSMSH